MRLIVLLLAVLTFSAKEYRPSHPPALAHPVALVPPSILWGVAAAESDFRIDAVSKDGLDRGMFQLRSLYDQERGVVDPFDPVEAAGHAARILAADRAAMGSWPLAITAYKYGRGGARALGVDRDYVQKVTDALPPNLLQGHDVTTVMPDGIIVFEAARAGVTWTGPLILEIDGRPSAKITLPAFSAAIPHRPWWPYVAAGGLGALAGVALGLSLR